MFYSFEKVFYKLSEKDRSKYVTNILNSIVVQYEASRNTSLFYYYSLQEGERPEHVAYDAYENAELHWIILLMNNVIDPFHDWYMSSQELSSHIVSKYGEEGANNIHHFINIDDPENPTIVDQYDEMRYLKYLNDGIELPHNISPVTNSRYEHGENEKKREIKVLSPKVVNQYVEQFERMMKNELKNLEDL
jgi:hypothetical protein